MLERWPLDETPTTSYRQEPGSLWVAAEGLGNSFLLGRECDLRGHDCSEPNR